MLEYTVGMPWPEGDENDLWALSAAWDRLVQELDQFAADLTASANNFSQVLQGTTGTSVRDLLAVELHNGAAQLKDQAAVFSEMLENAAADIQKTKIMVVAMLAMLAAAIASLLASIFGAFAVPSVIAAARVGIGTLLRGLMARLLEVGIVNLGRRLAISTLTGAALGASFMVGLDSAIQGLQIARGQRKGFDVASVKGGAIGGLIGGALGGFASGFGRALAKAGGQAWRTMPRGIRAFGSLGHSVLQIPAAAISNPVTNAATGSPGGVMDGIFGALEGSGKGRPTAPNIPAADVKPLKGLTFPAEASSGGAQPVAVKPAAGPGDQVNGAGVPVGSEAGPVEPSAGGNRRHASGLVSESRLGGTGWSGDTNRDVGEGRSTPEADRPAVESSEDGRPVVAERTVPGSGVSPEQSGVHENTVTGGQFVTRPADASRPADSRGRGGAPEAGADRDSRALGDFHDVERGDARPARVMADVKAADTGVGENSAPHAVTRERHTPARTAEPVTVPAASEPSDVPERLLAGDVNAPRADSGVAGAVPASHQGTGPVRPGEETTAAPPRRATRPALPTPNAPASPHRETRPDIHTLDTTSQPADTRRGTAPREQAGSTPHAPVGQAVTPADSRTRAASTPPALHMDFLSPPAQAALPARPGSSSTSAAHPAPGTGGSPGQAALQAHLAPSANLRRGTAPADVHNPATSGDDVRVRTESVHSETATDHPATDPIGRTVERRTTTTPPGEVVHPETPSAVTTAAGIRAAALPAGTSAGIGRDPIRPGSTAPQAHPGRPGADRLSGAEKVSGSDVTRPETGARTGFPAIAVESPSRGLPGSVPQTAAGGPVRHGSDPATPPVDDRRGAGPREQSTGALSRFAAVAPNSPVTPPDPRVTGRLEPVAEGTEPSTPVAPRFTGIDASGREVAFRSSELQVHRLRDKNGEPVGITFVTGAELGEVLSVTRTAYDGTTRLAPNLVTEGGRAVARTIAAPWPENSFYVHAHGFTGSFVVTTGDGQPLKVSGETFGHLLHDLRPFRDSMDRLKPEAVSLIVCLVGAVNGPGGGGHDFQRVLGQLGYEQPVVAATKVMGQRWNGEKATWGTHVTDGGVWRTFSSGPARVLGEDRFRQLTSFDPAAVRATPLISDGRVTGVSYRQGSALDRAVSWAAGGAQVSGAAPFPQRTLFVDAESTSDGRAIVHTEDGRRLAVEGGVFGRVVANTEVFRDALRDGPQALALLTSDAAKAPDLPAADSRSVEFARALEQEFGFQRPVFAPDGRVLPAEGADGRPVLLDDGVRWRAHLAPDSLHGLDDSGLPQLFRTADVQAELVHDGARPRALSFHDTGSSDHAALGRWIEDNGTTRHRDAPWSDDAFFIASPAGPSGFQVRLGDGRSLRIDGETFARVVAESVPFRAVLESATGRGPHSSPEVTAFPLLASASGRLTGPGGAARDFQQALAERFGYGQPVFAPSGRVEFGGEGQVRTAVAVSENGQWLSFPQGPLPVSGRDLAGRQTWFRAGDVQASPLREGDQVVGITFGPDPQRVQEWAGRPGKGVTHQLPLRQHDVNATQRSGVETARPAPWPSSTFYVDAAGAGTLFSVKVGQQRYGVDGENLAALVAQSEPFRQAITAGQARAITLLASKTGAEGGPAAGFQRALAERFGQDKPVYAPTNFLRLVTSGQRGATTVVTNGGEWATFPPEQVRPARETGTPVPLASIPEEVFPEISLRSAETGFSGMPRDLAVRVLDEGDGARSFELLGSREALRRFSVASSEGSAGGFTVSDGVTGARFHFSGDGTLTGAEMRLENDLGVLHHDFCGEGGGPVLRDVRRRPLDRFPVTVLPDGKVAVMATSPDGRALERLVVDPATGTTVEKSSFGRRIPFGAGSNRLSNAELRAIDDLAARTVHEGLAAFDEGRALPKVTVDGHGNGTLLGQPVESRAVQNGLHRAEAVRKAFARSVDRHLTTAASGRALTPAAADFEVEARSRGREYPAGTHREDGPDARRQAVITVTAGPARTDLPRPSVDSETPPRVSDERAHSETEPAPSHEDGAEPAGDDLRTEVRDPEPVAAQRGPTLQELMGSESTAETAHAELPWYVGQDGMDSLGEVAIRAVDSWDEHLVRSWTDEIVREVRRGGDSPALEADLRSALRTLLQGPAPDNAVRTLEAEQNRELDFWETVLQQGQLTTADGQVLWLRPVLRDVRPLPPREASDVQRYNVNWGSLTTSEKAEWEKGRSAESIFLATASTGLKTLSSLTSGPFLELAAHRSGSTHQHNYVIFDRKIWMQPGTPFRGGLHVKVFLNGVERLHDVVTPARLTVDLPKSLTAPGGLRHVPHPEPLDAAGEPAAGPHRAREIVNAVDLIPVTAEFQRRLHSAGLPGHGVRELMNRTLGLLNERAVMNRSRYFLGNEIATDRVTFTTGHGSSFQGHVTFRAVIEGLEYLGDSAKVAVREDVGGSTKVQRRWDGKSSVTLGGRVLAAPMEFVSVRAGLSRKAGHSHTEETSVHTVLQTTDDHSRYRAWLRVTVRPHSTTHDIEPVTRIVPTEIAVPRPEAADFERRVLGPDASRLRELPTGSDGPGPTPPYVRAPLAEAAEPGLGVPESAYRRPERLDTPLPPPHPREPLALAARRGMGFGTALVLPGAELVHDQLRTVLVQKHQEWTGQRRVDLSGADLVLLGGFGRAVLEGDVASLLSGLERSVRLGGETYQLSVRARFLERVGGVTGDDARAMSINLRASQVSAVGGHRNNSWNVGGFLGVRARLDVDPLIDLQLGQAGLSASFGRGTKQEVSGSAKTGQRIDMGGKADEHIINVVYELAVRSGDRVERWWIDRPGEVVARVVVPHLHVPREPVTADVLANAGRITPRPALPVHGTVDFLSNGTGAVFRSFLDVSGVERAAAHMYAIANKMPAEWLQDRGNWPAALKKVFSLTEVAAHFPALAGRSGRRVELPHGPDGRHQVLQVRVVAAHPRHMTAHGDGAPLQIWQNTSASTKYKRAEESSHSHGGRLDVGVVTNFGSGKDEGAEGGGGHSLNGRVSAVGGASAHRKFTADHGSATYPMGITRGTYSGPMHTYRADPVFEVSLIRWRNGGVVNQITGRSPDMTTTTRVLEVRDGLEFVVPERRISDLGLPVPDGVSRAEPKAPEGHFDLAMLPGSSHPEVLHAEGVLELVKGWLTEQGVLRQGPNGAGHLPTPLLGELEASLSSSALLNQFTLLNAGGVVRWWPIPSVLGSTRYLWVRVTAETTGTTSQLDRPEMSMMLRGKAFTEHPSSTSRSEELEVSADLRGRTGASGHGGLEAGAGYRLGRESSIEQNDDHLQIYWGQTKSASTEFQLRQRFLVEMRVSWQAPEVLSAPVRGVRAAAFAVAGLAGNRREAETWWQSKDPTASRFSGTVEGDVRVLVPSQLVVPGAPPVRAESRSTGVDPLWENDMPSPVNQELTNLVFEQGHPWALPAASGVNRWAALLTASSLSRPSLATPEFWRPDSTSLAGMEYEVFTHEVLLRLNMPSLLRNRYVVPVGGEKVNVGMRVLRVEPMAEHDVVMLSRQYNQAREAQELLRGESRGWYAGFGPEGGGDLSGGSDLVERMPGGFETEKSFEHAAESQEILERNAASTRAFRYYRADVEMVFYSRRHGWLRVTFPRGLYLMLPVSLSEHPALRDALGARVHRDEATAGPAKVVDLRTFLSGAPTKAGSRS
ncbi:hypothetical protein JNUCC0626_47955 [Lentzea sp. JNUCC 0626]|uniref:WXG100-like domain-containing protein n=1 Tax=Lentzea sp. JNUCC 0626 TaxID=3367513 RepID=UPI003747A8C6